MIDDSACTAVVYSTEYAAEVEPVLAVAENRPHRFMTEGDGDTVQTRLREVSPTLVPVAATADDACFWLYSSGSTGRPKGAVHRHRDIVVTCGFYLSYSLTEIK